MRIRMLGLSNLFFFVILACQPQGQSQGMKGGFECIKTRFNKSDSSGVFTGKVALWDMPSAMVSYRGLWLTDSLNDTIIFRVDSLFTQNIVEEKLRVGHCVKVTYRTENVEEDGIELNRFYYATKIDYPE